MEETHGATESVTFIKRVRELTLCVFAGQAQGPCTGNMVTENPVCQAELERLSAVASDKANGALEKPS